MRAAGAIGAGDRAGYAVGSLATGILNAVPTILLLFFATEIMRIPPAVAAVIMLLPKIWIVVWDPAVGAWSDRITTRWGRRIPFMLAGATVCLLSYISLFSPPSLSQWGTTGWVAASYFLLMCGYSLFAVPYMAVPTEVTDDDAERSALVRWRMTLAMIGSLVGAVGAPVLIQLAGGGRPGYRAMAIVIGLLCTAGMLAPVGMIRRHHTGAPAPVPLAGHRAAGGHAAARHILTALRNPRFALMLVAQILQVMAIGAFSSALPYLVTRGLGLSQGEVGTVLLVYLLPSIVAIPLWGAIARRIGDFTAQAAAALTYGAACLLIGLAVASHLPWQVALAPVPLLGIGFGGMQGQSFTIIARIIHADSDGSARATLTGMWTASERVGLALGPALSGAALAIWGGALAGWTAAGPVTLVVLSLLALFLAARASGRIADR